MTARTSIQTLYSLAVFSLLVYACAEGEPTGRAPTQPTCTNDCSPADAAQDFAFQDPGIHGDDQGERDGSEPGSVGTPCERDEECFSGRCTDVEVGKECTELCSSDEDCRAGFVCRTMEDTGADAVRFCIWVHSLCDPCELVDDCDTLRAACLQQENGTFCATPCDEENGCPQGFRCEFRTDDEWFCVPAIGRCGFELVRSEFVGTAQEQGSGQYRLRARMVLLPHRLAGRRFELHGGF